MARPSVKVAANRSSEVATVVPAELFRGLVENSVVGMLAIEENGGENGAIVFANARALELLEREGIQEFNALDLYPDKSYSSGTTLLSKDVLKREGLNPEVLIQKQNRHLLLVSMSVKRIQIENRVLVLVSFQDITIEKKLSRALEVKQAEIQRAYAELLEQNNQLKQLDQAKDRFIALMTHELRTPVSAILATAEVLDLGLQESEEQRQSFIRTICDQGRHLLELVNDVLDFAKIRAGKMEFFVENLELRDFCQKIVGGFSNVAIQSGLSLSMREAKSPISVWADRVRLKEILNNVLSNAIKYNRDNGSIEVWIDDQLDEAGRRFARVTVKDTGVGIAADKIKHVFNEFETVGQLALHHKGTGLGMPISRRLIESMGGTLTLKSQSGVGTEFYIDIPVEKILTSEMYRERPDQDEDFAA